MTVIRVTAVCTQCAERITAEGVWEQSDTGETKCGDLSENQRHLERGETFCSLVHAGLCNRETKPLAVWEGHEKNLNGESTVWERERRRDKRRERGS